jgi:tetratricopeptide (TPR) repeat protein
MGREDWYRRTTWSASDQDEFFERLDRSRGLYNKSQYARIQASYLQGAGYIRESLDLLNRVYQEWPDASQLPSAYWQEANCHLAMNDLNSAISAYRKCFKAEEDSEFRNMTNARVEFLWLVATRRLSEHYDEALEESDKWEHPSLFPVDQYRMAGALALIYDDIGREGKIAELAAAALEAAAKTDSGLRYHKGLGLVTNPDRKIIRKLKRLAKQ